MKTIHGNPLQSGVTKTNGGYNFTVRSFAENLTLEIYDNVGNEKYSKPAYVIDMDESFRTGDVFSVKITDADLTGCSYRYMCGKKQLIDDYARTISGCVNFGVIDDKAKYLSRIELDEFDWEEDKHPYVPFSDCIIYKLHVRGFTKSRTSEVSARHRGTFAGIIDKIPYLKSLGITTVELMPAYEFDEAGRFRGNSPDILSYSPDKNKINYWGYSGGGHFAPKAAYSSLALEDGGDYTVEFKNLVKALHREGIEIIMEMYFTSDESYMVADCLRYWVTEYHIDGVHIYCDENCLFSAVCDPVLGRTKLLTVYWNKFPSDNGIKHIASYNTGFNETAKRLLKGDENQLQQFVNRMRSNPVQAADINYITNHNGFTLMDLVSYDRKHNEENGESNRDGENFNYSWNCGAEGPSKKKKINELRLGQIKNAFAMLLTAQGTPLILAGDEFGNSQSGNNNPYCIDNETTWLDWKKTALASRIYDFVRDMIAFRKQHIILHMPMQLTASDGLSCGYPDISYHGDNAWYSRMESFERHIGIMYCEKYVKNKPEDAVIYIAYNFHWEKHTLALPDLPDGQEWKIVMSTVPDEQCSVKGRGVTVAPRSVTILEGSIAVRKAKKRVKGV